jgi:hypothetical protein
MIEDTDFLFYFMSALFLTGIGCLIFGLPWVGVALLVLLYVISRIPVSPRQS